MQKGGQKHQANQDVEALPQHGLQFTAKSLGELPSMAAPPEALLIDPSRVRKEFHFRDERTQRVHINYTHLPVFLG
jgi:hypothetical protein